MSFVFYSEITLQCCHSHGCVFEFMGFIVFRHLPRNSVIIVVVWLCLWGLL